MRIHITGNAGSGKTTLAKHLAQALDLPAYHLDAVVWQPGWKKTEASTRQRLETDLVAGPGWIIDGVSDYIRTQADLTIFLDVPRPVCLRRCLVRSFFHAFRSRPETLTLRPSFVA